MNEDEFREYIEKSKKDSDEKMKKYEIKNRLERT